MTTARIRIATSAAALALPLGGLVAIAPAQADVTAASAVTVQAKRKAYADVDTGPSRWEGRRLRHPRGGRFQWRVLRWANLVEAILREKGLRRKFLPGILAQIQQESSGDPDAVNRWDSNARAGHPSKGLLQVIAPTYRAYAKPGYRSLRYQTVPYTNIWAALEYVENTYGIRKFRLWNRGYNQGY